MRVRNVYTKAIERIYYMPLFPYLGEIAKIEKKTKRQKKATQKFGNVERFNHNENKNRRLPNLTFKILWALLV